MKNQTLDGKLLFAQNAISNALNNEPIKASLAEYGYDETKLSTGLALYQNAAKLQDSHKKEYGEQFAATDTLNLAKAVANKLYMTYVKVARIALKGDRSAEESLQLAGPRKESLSGWLKQAKAFYANALSSNTILEALAAFGITGEKLEQGLAKVIAVENNYNSQLKEKGEAQAATKQRDEAFDILEDWMIDFTAIAHIALAEQSQYLEALAIVEPS